MFLSHLAPAHCEIYPKLVLFKDELGRNILWSGLMTAPSSFDFYYFIC